MSNSSNPCPLCLDKQPKEFANLNLQRIFYRCQVCDFIFLRIDLRLDEASEKARYQLHQNDIQDQGYQAFVQPVVDETKKRISLPARGLDFGCGPGPVVTHLLTERGYTIDLYDPYFQPTPPPPNLQYDFVVCTEALEHFYSPSKELSFIRSHLKPGGHLLITTYLWEDKLPFENWSYQRDPTHVGFYSPACFRWIQRSFSFQDLQILNPRLIILKL